MAQSTCATALPIVANTTYTVSAVNGSPTSVICSPSVGGATASVWYSYTPAEDTSVMLTTDLPQNAGGDTRFHVYTGDCGTLSCFTGNDDVSFSNYLSSATFNVTAGVTYLIAFDNHWSSSGFDFRLTEAAQVDDFVGFSLQALAGGSVDCVVDLNGDHLDDAVSASANVIWVNYQLPGGGFNVVSIPTAPAPNGGPSWSICAGDLDGNGYNDLMYGSGSAVTFMLANGTGTGYAPLSFSQYVFCQRTNMVDINNDGHLDAFSCHDVAANVYFLNDGSNNFTFHQGGLGEDCGNYGSLWVDYDNDHDMDLFVAKCGCDPIDILYRNNGDGTFTNIAGSLGFEDNQQSWSSAWGDFDNDGDMDVMVGTSTGDYQKLMRNNGDGTFTNVTSGSGLDVFHGNSIEWTTHDLDNDGYLDILGGGRLLRNNHDMTFTPMQTPVYNGPIGDLNDDGFLDIVNGGSALINLGNANHHLTVNTVGTISNVNGIGARVEVTSALGTQIRDVRSGDGFAYMSSLNTHFGLGTDTEIDHVTVYWPSGLMSTVEHPAIDHDLTIVEDVNTAVGTPIQGATLGLYPNPADDAVTLVLPQGITARTARVFDATGKQVLEGALENGRLNIGGLGSGLYLLQVVAGNTAYSQKFTKR